MSKTTSELLHLLGRAKFGCLRACERGSESPDLFDVFLRPMDKKIAMFFWPSHDPQDTDRIEDETYSKVEFIAEIVNAAPDLLREVEALRGVAKAAEDVCKSWYEDGGVCECGNLKASLAALAGKEKGK